VSLLAPALQAIIEKIALSQAERDEASRQQNVVRDALRYYLPEIQQDFLTGSYARHTAIRPLEDIDMFVVLPEYPTLSRSPQAAVERVLHALERGYPSHAPRMQRRSVNIQFAQSGIGYDVVPALDAGNGVFHIPDRGRGGWIRSAPKRHMDLSTSANQRAGDKLKPLIKLIKYWNRANHKPLRSFHLEVMAYEALHQPPQSYAEGLLTVFRHLSARVERPLADPSGVGPDIDEGMTSADRAHAARLLRNAAEQIRSLDTYGDQAGLRRLLGVS
jgi:hypothetical protein